MRPCVPRTRGRSRSRKRFESLGQVGPAPPRRTRLSRKIASSTQSAIYPGKWRRQFTIRTIHWGLGGKWIKVEAEGLAYGELLDEWRKSQGRRWPVWQCAGCDEPIGRLSALLLADENRVHFDVERECLIRFGRRWRGEAAAGLRALGLEPPEAELADGEQR